MDILEELVKIVEGRLFLWASVGGTDAGVGPECGSGLQAGEQTGVIVDSVYLAPHDWEEWGDDVERVDSGTANRSTWSSIPKAARNSGTCALRIRKANRWSRRYFN